MLRLCKLPSKDGVNNEYGWFDRESGRALTESDIDCVGVELNYVGVQGCRFEGVVTAFEVPGTSFARPPFALNLGEVLAELDLARKTWEEVRAKYLEKDHFDIGPGQLLLILGATF